MPDLTSARRNSAIWLGLLLILLAIFSNTLYFFHLPDRALPWLNVALPILAFVVLMVGAARAFRQPHFYRGKIWGTILAVLSLLICVASVLFFMVAHSVPGSAGAPQLGQRVPDFTLPDSTGQPVSLSQLFSATPGATPPKAVLLVFYRGYW